MSGVGPEVTAKALARADVKRALVPVVFGDGPTFERFSSLSKLRLIGPDEVTRVKEPTAVAVTALAEKDRVPGKPTVQGGRAQYLYIEAAIAAAKRGFVDAICTAPVSKEQISRAGIPFMGHTEVLADAFGVDVLMLMDGPGVRVALATNHLALRDVPKALRKDKLARQLLLLHQSFMRMLRRRPKIGVCGLNPHAGEGGLLGDEERRAISPAIAAARKRGVDAHGPLPADGLFAKADRMPYDVVLAMFHDQGLIAAKALDFEETVNVTLGLPLPRTSPDHGTAYDIAGNGVANEANMANALLKAARYAR